MTNTKKRILASVLAAGTILTFSGCAEHVDDESDDKGGAVVNDSTITESNSDNKKNDDTANTDSNESKSDETSKPADDEKPKVSVFDDLQAISKIENMTSCDIDAEIEFSDMKLSTKAGISYDKKDNLAAIDLKSLSIKTAGDDVTPSQEINLGKSNILIDMNDKTGYIGLDLVYQLMAMSSEDSSQVKAQFESTYPDAEYMKIDLSDSVDDITSSVNIDTTVTAPEGISEENLKSWFETSCKSVLEQYLKPVAPDFENSKAPAGMNGLIFNNKNLMNLLDACDDMVSSKDFKDSMFELYDMSSDKSSIETMKSEFDANLTECKDFIEQATEFLSDKTMNNQIDFEIATLVSEDSARFTLNGDFDVVGSMGGSSDGSDFDDFSGSDFNELNTDATLNLTNTAATAPKNPITRVQASFDIDVNISTVFVDLTAPETGKYIDSTETGDPTVQV